MSNSTIARWQSWDGLGLEHLLLREEPNGIVAESLLIGDGDSGIALSYCIDCDPAWRVRRLTLRLLGEERMIDMISDGAGHWGDASGTPLPELRGAIDVDISATPFTNTLPIRRLMLSEGESAVITVAYVSVPSLTVTAERQRYTCLKPLARYRYESLSSGFTRDVEVDEKGLVTLYPDLFRRSEIG